MSIDDKIIKICRKHATNPPCTLEQICLAKHCRICWRLKARKYYRSPAGKSYRKKYEATDKRKAYAHEYSKSGRKKEVSKLYRIKNRERLINYRIKYDEENRETRILRGRRNHRIAIDNLKSSYIISLLKGGGISKDNITPNLINIRKLLIQAKRLIKQEKENVNK